MGEQDQKVIDREVAKHPGAFKIEDQMVLVTSVDSVGHGGRLVAERTDGGEPLLETVALLECRGTLGPGGPQTVFHLAIPLPILPTFGMALLDAATEAGMVDVEANRE